MSRDRMASGAFLVGWQTSYRNNITALAILYFAAGVVNFPRKQTTKPDLH
jgi:hypothetical protein